MLFPAIFFEPTNKEVLQVELGRTKVWDIPLSPLPSPLPPSSLPRDAVLAPYMLSSCVCPSVSLSVTSRYCIETTRQIELVLAGKLPLTYPKLYYKEIPPKNKGTSLRNFASNSRLRKFRHGLSMVWSTKVVDCGACGLHVRRSSESWLNAQEVVPTLVCSSWQDFDWHIASRAPSAVAEFLVFPVYLFWSLI